MNLTNKRNIVAVQNDEFVVARRLLQMQAMAVVLILLISICPALGSPPDMPTNLRVNDVVNPVGIGNSPFFGWYVNDPDKNEIQTAYQVLVASSDVLLGADVGDVWDSGKVSSRLQNHIHFAGSPLQSDHRYVWKVRTWDSNDDMGRWSEPVNFTVGLLENPDWSGACWIKRDTDDTDDYTYYRKKVELPAKSVERATVYISSVHKYALYVNGQLVGKGPAYHYPQFQYYNAYDITPLIHSGTSNLFAIFNHWFGGGQGRPASEPGVIMKSVIHYTDGSHTVIDTDGTWRQSRAMAWVLNQPHRNRGEGVGYIEKIDAREINPDWNSLDYDDSSREVATVIGVHPVKPWIGSLTPDLTRIDEHVITPISITHKEDNRYLVDLGKVYAGMPRIHFSGGTAGETVEMLGGYALDDSGRIVPSKNQSTDMRYYTVLSGETFTYEPVEYLGMRYFEIKNPPKPITESNFSFIVRNNAMDEARSSFESSNATLDAVWGLMKHSLFTCAQEEFVDTPTREKGGFLGDGAIQSTVAMSVMNERLLTQRVLNEFLQSMDQYWSRSHVRGRMNAVYPNKDGARDIPDFTQSYLVWIWNYYLESGDREFLATNYAKFKDIADYVYRYQNESTGLITNLEGGSGSYNYGIVDWPATMRFGYDMTAARTVINGWAYADFNVITNIAQTLGNGTDRDTYRVRAEELKAAMNKQLINDAGCYVDGLNSRGEPSSHVSQHANMFPLALGIVPKEHLEKVINEVKKQQMSVGMVTLPWLIRAIGEANEGEHLIELFTNSEWLGWARCLSLGATATWEEWDAYSTESSMSHAWGTSGLEGYVRYILGIKPLKPQYEQVLIKPLDFGAGLEWAKGIIPTDRGTIAVYWKHEPDVYELRINLPVNVSGRVAIPRGNTDNPVISLDGTVRKGIKVGGYIVIENVGSGEHTIVRQ
mgnify:CR=1 FL=1